MNNLMQGTYLKKRFAFKGSYFPFILNHYDIYNFPCINLPESFLYDGYEVEWLDSLMERDFGELQLGIPEAALKQHEDDNREG